MKKLRAAVVGVGYLGNFHAQKYKNNPDCNLIGVCDSSAEQAKKIGSALSVDSYSNPKDLIGKVDLVTVACSTQYHYEVVKLFLEEGIPVNVEKPMTATLEQAEKLVEISERKNVLLTVGHIERFSPSVNEVKNKSLGFTNLELTRWSPFKFRGSDVSVIFDLLIHDIDLVFWFNQGRSLKNWMCSGDVVVSKNLDRVNVVFEFEEQNKTILTTVSVNRSSFKPVRKIRLDTKQFSILADTATHEIEMWDFNPRSEKDTDRIQSKIWTLDKIDSLQLETDCFVNSVLGQSRLRVTAQDGLTAMKWADAIEKRLRS